MLDNTLDINCKKNLIRYASFKSANILTKIFLNIFLFKVSGDVKIVAMYNIIYYGTGPFFDILTGKMIKRGNKNIILYASLGFIFTSLLLVLLGERVIHYYWLIAILLSLFGSLFWCEMFNNELILTNVKNRGNYMGVRYSTSAIVGILIPSISGGIISINYLGFGYEIVFLLSAIFYTIGLFIKIENNYVYKSEFSLIKLYHQVKDNKNIKKLLLNSLILNFAFGNIILDIIMPVILYYKGVPEIDIGMLLSLFSFLSISSLYLYGRFVSKEHYKKTYLFVVGLYLLSIIQLFFNSSFIYFAIFTSIIAIISRFSSLINSTERYNTFEEAYKNMESSVEYSVLMDIIDGISNTLVFVLILLVGTFSIVGINIIFGIFALLSIISAFLFFSLDTSKK